jgi:D-alanyl-lipoteichoic acid acyltransferase DltB (MBOAT superfamily)
MIAAGPQDFWRRWHITLSRWLRDYLYIPLGGNRTGHAGVNLMITMLLGGLWHGGGWHFVVWGGIHGLALLTGRYMPEGLWGRGWPGLLIRVVLFQIFVVLTWVFFRSISVGLAIDFVAKMVPRSLADMNVSPAVAWPLLFAVLPVAHQFAPAAMRWIGHRKLPYVLGAVTGLFLLASMSIVIPGQPFIYFKF